MKDEAVRERLREAYRENMSHVIGRLQMAANQAIDALCEVQSSGESESAKVQAARCVLEQALRAAEIGDIQERLDKLEAIAKSRWKGPNDEQPNHTPAERPRTVNGHPE